MRNRKRHIIQTVVFLLLLVPNMARAQWNFDAATVEALIDDHKRIRSDLLARSGLEQANQLLHDYAQAAAVDYDSLNVKLDKYTKCFDLIDIIYNGGMAVMNVYTTSSDVTQRIGQLEQLIEKFVTECAARGNILSSDTLIIGACRRCVSMVISDGEELIKSLVDLGQYAAGREITTEGLMDVIMSINEHLDNIRNGVDHTYYVIWKYVTIRTHYYKRQTLYNAKTVREMCDEAFGRWRTVTRQVGY